ncbi:MAG: ribosome biogenesis GTPase YlqF [Oscillospiraceae bacterium]|nr:ribosome biogenesis GTPase YlqF [Oscillospiraceae bacterium]
MSEVTSVQWFPGHMAKTKRLIKENLPLVDAVIEIIDARIPQSSANPDLRKLIGGKTKLVLLNKCDYADGNATAKWVEWYKKQGVIALPADCRSGKGLNRFTPSVKLALADLISKNETKGMAGKSLRLMVVGIPNVGKSSLINRLSGRKKTKVEDRPGVTREKQWVKLAGGLELLDMPGVLWAKFEDPLVGERLAFTGAVKDDVTDTEALAGRLLLTLSRSYRDNLRLRYKIEIDDSDDGHSLLLKAAKSRGMLLQGGEVDSERAAIAILDEYRAGKLGRVTLELPT